MPTVKITTIVECDIGTQFNRMERTANRTVGDAVMDKIVLLVDGNVAGSQVTLFDASVDTYAAGFLFGAILVDVGGDGGEGDYEDDATEARVAIDFVGDAVSTPAINIRREAIFNFSSSAAGGPAGTGLTTIDGTITQIRARNNNAAPSSGDADVLVRIILFGA